MTTARAMTTARDRPPEEAGEDTSFARGLRVLLTIADRGELRADELSALLDTPISTIYRYLRTLGEFGFVERIGTMYRLGPRLLIGSRISVTAESLIRAAEPVLARLAEATGETAVIGRRVGLGNVILHEVPSIHPLRVSLGVRNVVPLHLGAISKVLLAFAPAEVLDAVLADGLAQVTRYTPDEAGLRRELAGVVASGIARSHGEFVTGSVSLAVPIALEDGIVAAIGVIGPDSRCGASWRARAAALLPAAARELVDALAPASHQG